MTDRTEQLIREAFAAEAEQAPDARAILAELNRARSPRRRTALVAAAAAVVAVALVAVAIPNLLDRNINPAAGGKDQNVLVVGLDKSRAAELLVLVHLDADGTADVVSLPGLAPRPDGSTYALDEVYDRLGPDRLLADVEKLTGVSVDHYAALDMAVFGDLADAVGGVPVCLKEATKDPDSGVSFPAGVATVNGAKTLAFLRQKSDAKIPYPAVEERQLAFLAGLAGKARDADLRAVRGVLDKHLRTDRDLDLLAVPGRLREVTGVRFAEVTAGLDVPMEVGPNRKIVLPIVTARTFITDMFAGKPRPGGPGTPELPYGKQKCVY